MPAPIPCRFDELSVDIAENQILRTAALAIATFPEVAPAVRRDLRRTAGVLDGVGNIDPRAIPPVNLTRLNSYYEPALRMAEMILRSGGVRDRVGALEASTFLIDMNHLFEKFVTIQLRRLLAGKLEVRDQEQSHLDVGRTIPMRPDLVFYRRGEPVLVADIKYKLTDDGRGRSADYYQLLAYCKAVDVNGGVLIYSTDDLTAFTIASVVNDGPVLRVEPLDLRGDQTGIRRALEALAATLVMSQG
jgi:5-methylcytosine-specific restriction enzyme subunit McrC